MARHERTAEQKAKNAAAHRELYRLGRLGVQTPEGKRKKRARDKVREQTPKYKAWAAARYRARREAVATHPRPDLCEVCGKAPNGKGALHLDHCHTTGAFRGWLCHSCNLALGEVGDDSTILRKLADYLDRFERPPGEYLPKRQAQSPIAERLPLLDGL